MSLYRVTHTVKLTGTQFSNTVAAKTAEQAIAMRNDDLGICEFVIDDYAVKAEHLPDPDGSQEARWIAIEQLRRYTELSRF